MPAQNENQKFHEIIHPGAKYEFIGKQRYWIGLSIILVTITVVMLPLNMYVFKDRGHALNWGVDFRGGSEILVEFSKPVDAGDVRKALDDIHLKDAEVVKSASRSPRRATPRCSTSSGPRAATRSTSATIGLSTPRS
jgi:preprotein translocase subunit SecF